MFFFHVDYSILRLWGRDSLATFPLALIDNYDLTCLKALVLDTRGMFSILNIPKQKYIHIVAGNYGIFEMGIN